MPITKSFPSLVLSVGIVIQTLTAITLAQAFSSGSTGADGPFAPTAPPPGQTVEVIQPLPPSGVFNFTTVAIPSGVKVTFVRNAKNTPVIILATGDVNISGTISVRGQSVPASQSTFIYTVTNYGGIGGPGGFNGGNGASALYVPGNASCDATSLIGFTGDGPGGGGGGQIGPITNGSRAGGAGGGGGFSAAGQAGTTSNGGSGGSGGERYGSPSLIPMIGGSGGGGAAGECGLTGLKSGGGGAGGGGAILIASSTKIILNGPNGDNGFDQEQPVIDARGGDVYTSFRARGGAGAGGSVRLIANEIAGQGWVSVRGGKMMTLSDFPAGGTGGDGIIRFETPKLTFAGKTLPQALYSLPGSPDIMTQPSIVVTSIGGITAPDPPNGSLQSDPDIRIPDSNNQVTIAITTTKIPVGTQIRLRVITSDGSSTTVLSAPVTGSLSSGSASATVTLPSGQSLIRATATFVNP